MRRAYLDTCLLIYWVEQADSLAEAVFRWLSKQTDVTMCVSPLVRMEVLVKPQRTGNLDLVRAYETLLAAQEWLPINDELFQQALDLRVRFGLKTPDAIHLAIAQYYRCDEIWTNDDRLNKAAGTMAVNILAELA
jgi:predicted nucleic acid-binding protein